jgi:UDP-glucuronate decarboxylase
MKRILVTGGAGFLGSFLCEKLLAMGSSRGDEVISLDNYFSGSKKNIEHLLSNPRFEAIRHDVTQPIHLEIDEIYNLACPASPIHYQHNPVHTTKTCVMGAINMLELARNVKAKIIQASTSEIYGDPLAHPQNEEYFGNVNTIGARSCYDEGKRVAETLFYDYHRQYGVEIKIVRIFNTYGPRMAVNDGRVVSNFIIQALKGDEITVCGDGKQTRSFCYVDDLIDGITNFMNLDSNEFGPINLGNPNEFTILELAEKIIKLTKSRSKIIFKSLPQNDPLQRKPVIEKAQKLINFSPKIDLETGLEKTITYFKQTI